MALEIYTAVTLLHCSVSCVLMQAFEQNVNTMDLHVGLARWRELCH